MESKLKAKQELVEKAKNAKLKKEKERLAAKEAKLKKIRDKRIKGKESDKITLGSMSSDDIKFLNTDPTATAEPEAVSNVEVEMSVHQRKRLNKSLNPDAIRKRGSKVSKSGSKASRTNVHESQEQKSQKAIEVRLRLRGDSGEGSTKKKGRSRSRSKSFKREETENVNEYRERSRSKSTRSVSRSRSRPRHSVTRDSSGEAVEVSGPPSPKKSVTTPEAGLGDGWKILAREGSSVSPKKIRNASEDGISNDRSKKSPKKKKSFHGLGGFTLSPKKKAKAEDKAKGDKAARQEEIKKINAKTLAEYYSGSMAPAPSKAPKRPSASDSVTTFQRFHALLVAGVKVLKLSSSGVWQKKILTVSREALSVTNPSTGDTLENVPIALVWVSDEKGKSLDQMEKPGKPPIRSARFADKPRHGNGGIFMEEVTGMTFEEGVDLGIGDAGGRTPNGKNWDRKYDLGSVLTVCTRDETGYESR